MARKPTEKELLCGLEICELCRGFKGRILSGHRRKSVAGKPEARLLQQPDHIILFNRVVRQFSKATGIVDAGFVQIQTISVTKPVVKPLRSDINTVHTGERQKILVGAWSNGRGGIRTLGEIAEFGAGCAMFGR